MGLRPTPIVLVVTALLATACGTGSDDGEAVDRTEVVSQIAAGVIVPGYEELASATSDLQDSSDALCASPDEAGLDAARDAWDSAMGAWMSTSAFGFGPVRSLRSDAKIAYPVDPGKIDGFIGEAGTALPEVDELGDVGADARGLNAVQYLLFAPAGVDELSPAECAYAAGASSLVADGAAELLTAWTDGIDGERPFAEQFSDPGADSMWSSATEGLEDLLNSTLSTLTTVIDRGLGPATGETTGSPEPQEVDEAPAHRALQDMIDQLDGVAAVYGDSSTEPPTGLSWLVTSTSSSNSDEAIRSDLANAIGSLEDVPPPLFDVDARDPDSPAMEALVDASQHAMAVRSALSTEVASLLGLTVGFSDSDGDA